MAQGHHAGAGEGGDVDDHARFEAFGVGEGVAENQPAFGVGVEHLDGLPRQGGDDVAGLVGVAVGQVFAGRHDAHDVEFRFEFGNGFEGAENAGGAAHVVFHFVHGLGRLEGNAAGIEGNALAHQGNRFVFPGRAPVVHDDQSGGLPTAFGHG